MVYKPREIPEDALPYHRQDEHDFCGAACAQMLLHCKAIGQPLIDQALLTLDLEKYSTVFDPAVAWDAEPDAIVGLLEEYKGNYPGTFEVKPFETEKDLSRAIVESLDRSMERGADKGIPVIVLTFGLKHWVLVVGFETNQKPQPGENYKIKRFRIYDPLPAVKRERGWPPIHTDGADGVDLCTSESEIKERDGRVWINYPDEWTSTEDITTADIIGDKTLQRQGYIRRVPPGTGSVWEKFPVSTFIAIMCNP